MSNLTIVLQDDSITLVQEGETYTVRRGDPNFEAAQSAVGVVQCVVGLPPTRSTVSDLADIFASKLAPQRGSVRNLPESWEAIAKVNNEDLANYLSADLRKYAGRVLSIRGAGKMKKDDLVAKIIQRRSCLS